MPKRIQLSRRKGFKLPSGTVNCARPARWGNPFRWSDEEFAYESEVWRKLNARSRFRQWLFSANQASHLRLALQCLRGHDLACWCKPGEPCHADVLLEVVNDPRAEPLKTVCKGDEVVIMGDRSIVDRVPDSLGWGSFEFSGFDDQSGGVYHSSFGPVYSLDVLDLCAGKPLPQPVTA